MSGPRTSNADAPSSPVARRPPIVVIAGATATGKTAAAVALATRLGGELVGADSIQVYRGFDIGSAKPTPEELAGVPHHLLDVLEPTEGMDAMGWATMADRVIDEIVRRSRVPIVVGGTGLWLRALLRGLVDVPPPDPAVRARLEAEVQRRGAPALHVRLTQVDPLAARAIHPHDAVRIVRALEVQEQTGEALGALRAAHRRGAPRYPATLLVLERPPNALAAGIEARIDAMLQRGWLEEIRTLVATYGSDLRPLRSVGYRQLLPHVLGRVPFPEARRAAAKATRHYARRQRNWFATDPDVLFRTHAEAVIRGELDEAVRARLAARVAG